MRTLQRDWLKTCAVCNKPFDRHENERLAYYRKRKTCSRPCAFTLMVRNRNTTRTLSSYKTPTFAARADFCQRWRVRYPADAALNNPHAMQDWLETLTRYRGRYGL